MADRMLFLSWGQVVRGREERALEVFNESVRFYGRMQQEGRIESFDVALLEPHGGSINGYFALHASASQLAELRETEEFRRLQIDVSMIIDDLRVVNGLTGDGLAREMSMFAEAVSKAAQHA
jgi:hypothetical protein